MKKKNDLDINVFTDIYKNYNVVENQFMANNVMSL